MCVCVHVCGQGEEMFVCACARVCVCVFVACVGLREGDRHDIYRSLLTNKVVSFGIHRSLSTYVEVFFDKCVCRGGDRRDIYIYTGLFGHMKRSLLVNIGLF